MACVGAIRAAVALGTTATAPATATTATTADMEEEEAIVDWPPIQTRAQTRGAWASSTGPPAAQRMDLA